MSHAVETYKFNENDYVRGIESPHGRIQIIFDTILINLEKVQDAHPKTDFVSFGKCLNGLNILANSLDMEKGGDLAVTLVELYDYCSRKTKDYLVSKDKRQLQEVMEIIINLSDGWKQIK